MERFDQYAFTLELSSSKSRSRHVWVSWCGFQTMRIFYQYGFTLVPFSSKWRSVHFLVSGVVSKPLEDLINMASLWYSFHKNIYRFFCFLVRAPKHVFSHWFQWETCVFLMCSIGSHAKHLCFLMFSICFHEKAYALQWFCIGISHNSLVSHWSCIGINEKAIVLQWCCIGIKQMQWFYYGFA